MGLGIQIKKPEQQSLDKNSEGLLQPDSAISLSPMYKLMTGLTFLSALVALYFFFQSRSV